MKDLDEVLKQVDPQHKGNIWIGGDFNTPKIDWNDQTILPSNSNVKVSQVLVNTVNDFALTQVVDHPTRKTNILDLFFTTNPNLINRVTTIPPLSAEADHDVVFIDVNSRAYVPRRTPTPRFMYKKADWDSMRNDLSNYTLPSGSVQIQWDHLESTIGNLMKKHIPTKTPRPQKHKPWITREIITIIQRRNRLYSKWKASKTPDLFKKFTTLRSECQRKLRKAQQDYLDNIFDLENNTEEGKGNATKRFWTFIKSRKKDSCSVAPLHSQGVLISDAKGKANILNQQYCSVFPNDSNCEIPSKGPSTAPSLPNIIVTEFGVLKMLKKLNPNKAAGPDKISHVC